MDRKAQDERNGSIVDFGELVVEASRYAEDNCTAPAVASCLFLFKLAVVRVSEINNGGFPTSEND